MKFCEITGGIRVAVPDSINLLTPYVLEEQRDWFEDEIRIARILVREGQRVIDIGANYGLYTLSLAHIVGPRGRVWAFEPAACTAKFLAASVAKNGFGQVTIDQRAVSSKSGTARLSLHEDAEHNEIVRGDAGEKNSEVVALTTLDAAMAAYGWSDIDFLKIDAEGEEAAIIQGGVDFFSRNSPVIQYEVQTDAGFHLELVDLLDKIGYSSYRLVPGLNILIPFDPSFEEADPFLLNLFAIKDHRADLLEAEGLLLRLGGIQLTSSQEDADSLPGKWGLAGAFSWRSVLTKLPYGRQLEGVWNKTISLGQSTLVEQALALHAVAHTSHVPIGDRFLALRRSFLILKEIGGRQPDYFRLSSLARVAREYGARAISNIALTRMSDFLAKHRLVNLDEPFLPAEERFDWIDPGSLLANWAVCGCLEALERNFAQSSFYLGMNNHPRLSVIRDLGFGSAEMARRLDLVERRHLLQSPASH